MTWMNRAINNKPLLILGILTLCLALFPQQLTHEVGVVNIEVPVRVFDGDSFVDNLSIDDFEVYEDGIPQEIAAVYLIRKTAVERREETRPFAPKTSRTFYLIFEAYEYNPRFHEAIAYFVNNVLTAEDRLVVATPTKTYRLKKEWTSKTSKDRIIERLSGILNRDILLGNTEYRTLLDELTRLLAGGGAEAATGLRTPDLEATGSGSWEEFMAMYRDLRQRLENLRSIDEKRLLDFAKYLKTTEGQKDVFLFYQREIIPVLDRKRYIGVWEQSYATEISFEDLFDFFKRDISINADLVKKAFADSSIAIHFMFITTPPESVPGLGVGQLEEHSEDLFSPFLEMAVATGGLATSSSNPAAMMKKASAASENYYLLYYAPRDYKADGKFREIKIAIKGKNYRVAHRAGYFAN